ncbi:hypothetical protein Tco_0045228 [Tanacetum coccineum]|uniref:Uncharacterized protein n=1 Tax=Tanacetum coccineum TaxID=301880 RepID=A0ABQ5AMI6_9ASTR
MHLSYSTLVPIEALYPTALVLIDIVPNPLDNSYDVELADGKIVRIYTIIREHTIENLGWAVYHHIQRLQESWAKDAMSFLAQISAKKEEDKSEGKQIKDVPIVEIFQKCFFLEDVASLPLGSPREFSDRV